MDLWVEQHVRVFGDLINGYIGSPQGPIHSAGGVPREQEGRVSKGVWYQEVAMEPGEGFRGEGDYNTDAVHICYDQL